MESKALALYDPKLNLLIPSVKKYLRLYKPISQTTKGIQTSHSHLLSSIFVRTRIYLT
jgi:hypothetical protein